MKFTYDLNTHGCLIITMDESEREQWKAKREEIVHDGGNAYFLESVIAEALVINSELDETSSDETGDLTDAPMFCLRDEEGEVTARWAFMDYQIKLWSDELIDTGKVVFIS